MKPSHALCKLDKLNLIRLNWYFFIVFILTRINYIFPPFHTQKGASRLMNLDTFFDSYSACPLVVREFYYF